MTLTIDAIYDGQVFRPAKPVSLKPNTPVTISVIYTEGEEPLSFLDVALRLQLDGPPDWSQNLDEYLYGGKIVDEE
jgi:predicted DNA-binding antitoxin AbrB/MazE fold protein